MKVDSIEWIEALATEWERRATVLDALPHSGMVEMVMAQSFRDRAEDLRRTHDKAQVRLGQHSGAHDSLLAFVEKWNVEIVKKWKETRDSKGHWIAIHSPQWGHTEDLRRRRETSLEMLRWTVQWFKDRGHEIECQIMSDGESIGICEANDSSSATP